MIGPDGASIVNCFSTGNVTGGDSSNGLGGLVGYNYIQANIINCFSTGNVVTSGDDLSWNGGLVGYSYQSSVNHCYFLSGVGPDDGNGVPLTDAQMRQQSSFVGWDFINIWKISEGVSYPKLAWQPDCDIPSIPVGMSASDGTYTDKVRVTWSPISGAIVYEVWRSASNSSSSASKLDDYTSPFDDSSVTPGTTYYYWVKAKNSCGTSDFSSSDSGYASTNPKTVSITKCNVTAGSKLNSDKISISGLMDATADDFNDANNSSDANFVEVTISSENAEDMDPCVFTFPVNNKTFKKGKFSSAITSKPLKMSFAFDTKKSKFSFSARNVDLTGLSCPVIVTIQIGNLSGSVSLDETIVNGPKKPIPINLLMGVKNSLRVDKPKFTKKSGVITSWLSAAGSRL